MNEAQSTTNRRAPIEPSEAHVLVVEDNVPNFVLIARMLAFMGVQRCEWKTSGWQVVQFADTLPRVDLILMDIRLPYEDGYQALQKLRGNPRLKDTFVCAVTAEASEDQMRRAKKAGFNGLERIEFLNSGPTNRRTNHGVRNGKPSSDALMASARWQRICPKVQLPTVSYRPAASFSASARKEAIVRY